jgi:hypothetical protein
MGRHSTHARDAAIAQLTRMNRWLLAGSVLLTGVFAEIAASAFPGRKRQAASHHAAGPSAHRQPTGTSTAPLKPPEQAPGVVGEGSGGESPPPAAESQGGSGEAGSAPSERAPESQSAPEAPRTSEAPPAESAPSETPSEAGGPVVSGGS